MITNCEAFVFENESKSFIFVCPQSLFIVSGTSRLLKNMNISGRS